MRRQDTAVPAPAWKAYAPWLKAEGSLTRRLLSVCQHFEVQVLSEKRTREGGLIREVLLCCDQLPVVFARSVYPLPRVPIGRQLKRLGNQPLGSVLFGKKSQAIQREPLRFFTIQTHHSVWRRRLPSARLLKQTVPKSLPARISAFSIQKGLLSVTEVFLPAILSLPSHHECSL